MCRAGFFIDSQMPVSIEDLYSIYLKHPNISTDSRKLEKGSLFFALQGDNFDGNEYAAQAAMDGCSYALVDDEKWVEGDQFLLVNDVAQSLQELATYHRSQLNIPVVCITGSNGKTTTKELLTSVLDKKYKVVSTLGNLNNHLGVPLSVLRIDQDSDIAVIELGANHIGEIEFLCGIANPTHGLITNIGKAHLEGFGDLDGVKRAKSELYQYLRKSGGQVFVNRDNETLIGLSSGLRSVQYGTTGDCYCVGTLISSDSHLQLSFNLNKEELGESNEINSQLLGDYNFENILAAICIGSFFDVAASDIVDAVENYVPDNSRSQEIKTDNNRVIMDAYNANPMNMKAALDNFTRAFQSNRMVILGDMLELGAHAGEEHQAIIAYLRAQSYDRVILVGEEYSKVCSMLRCEHFASVDEARIWLESSPPSEMNILVKGSRGIGLEVLLDKL